MTKSIKCKQVCSVKECNKTMRARGWCSTHYKRWQTHGDPLYNYIPVKKRGVLLCKVSDCDRFYYTKGYCQKHYQAYHKYGDPLEGAYHHSTSLADYLSTRYEISASGCWLWTKCINRGGYGMATARTGREDTVLAHRLAYQAWVGPISKALVVHHKCHTPICINPDHLQAITQRENTAEMIDRQSMLKEICELKKRIQELEQEVRALWLK